MITINNFLLSVLNFLIEGLNFTLIHKFYLLFFILSTFTYQLIIQYKKYFVTKKSREFLTMGTHQEKQIIPSMGGIGFFWFLPALYIYLKNTHVSLQGFFFIFLSTVLSSFVGALDDVYKIKYGKGLQIKPKFFLQMMVSFIPAVYYWYVFPEMCFIKFPWAIWNFGQWYILWIVWVLMATTHAVNLIDGVDGLAISQAMLVLYFSPLLFMKKNVFYLLLSSFYPFWTGFNRYKAKLFMGDIGSFFLGGLLASVFIFFKVELLLIVSGIVFVLNTLICIIQIISFKIRKKRIFSFTPYHHALEKRGWPENKIVVVYSFITLLFSIISIWVYMHFYRSLL